MCFLHRAVVQSTAYFLFCFFYSVWKKKYVFLSLTNFEQGIRVAAACNR